MTETETETLAPTERPDLAQRFNYTPYRESDFQARGMRSFIQYRDLGLAEATGGLMRAEHLRVMGVSNATTGWHCHDLDFQFVYILKGQVGTRTREGETFISRAGDCAHLPGLFLHDEVDFSPDYEVLLITAPGDYTTIHGDKPVAPAQPRKPGYTSKFVADYDKPEAYKVGDGPRRFLAYRDVGVTAATGRRVNINVVRNSKAGDQSTGWHWHSLACQFVYVLQGWSRVEVEGEGEFTLRQGETMTIPRGLKHDVTGFSEDFKVLEMNIPGDYETVACDRPA